jgi:hypothetical protein
LGSQLVLERHAATTTEVHCHLVTQGYVIIK